jgi:TPR repeat
VRRLVVLAAVALAACQQVPAPKTPISRAVSPGAQPSAQGDAFMAKGDYVSALEKYRQASDLEPEAIRLHFALGTAYSFLEKRPEAIAQFTWVIGHALAVSPGVDIAPTQATVTTDSSSSGRLAGTTEWPGVTPRTNLKGALVTGETTVWDEKATVEAGKDTALKLSPSTSPVPPGKFSSPSPDAESGHDTSLRQ